MRNLLRLSLLTFVVCLLLASIMWAQTSRGTVAGIVTDQQGASIPGAKVELLNTETGVKRSSATNEAGLFRFDAVDLGPYDLTVTANGFQTFAKRGLPVTAGQVVSQDVTMTIGETKSVVEVSAETQPILQYESAVHGGSITQSQITQLPISSRDPTNLALTLPGVSTNRFAWGNATVVVNGGRGRSNNFMIDGTDNNDVSVAGQAFQVTNPDAIAEVSTQTSNYDAEFGRAGGAVINTITKSGTNEYHGTASYLVDVTRDDAITNTQSLDNAVIARGHPMPGTDQTFGGAFGGPIRRDKTFFFAALQQQRQRSMSSTNLTVPSAAGLATLNSLYPQGASRNADIYRQVLGDVRATSQFSDVSMGPGRPAVQFGTAMVNYSQAFTDTQMIAKGDHSFSEKDLASLRYMLERQNVPAGFGNADFPGFFTSNSFKYHNVALTETHIFSPQMTNELRLGFNRSILDYPIDPENEIGLTLPRYTIGGGLTAIGVATTFPQGRLVNNYLLQDTVSYIRGTHSFRFGLNINQQRARQFAPIRERGEITYGNTTGYSNFANFIDDVGGATGGVQRDFGSAAYFPSYTRHAYFFQDRWRVTKDFTLTLGVRYEYFGLPMNTLKKAAFSGLFNIDTTTWDGPYREYTKVEADRNNWSPTVGFAYSPSSSSGFFRKLLGERATVIRGGYQVGYDSFFNNIASNAATATPNVIATSVTYQASSDSPRGVADLSQRLPTSARQPLPTDSQTLMSRNLVNPYYQRWSFGIQRQIPGDMQVEVSYVGSKGTRLFINEDFNPVVPLNMRIRPATPPYGYTNRFDALQGSRLTRTNGGSSSYNSLQIEANRRMSKGLLFRVAYTWSKNLDNSSEVFGNANVNSPQQTAIPSIFGGLTIDRAFSLFDRTHRASFTYVYDLPLMREQKGFVGRALGGWSVSGVTAFESGVPGTVANGFDADGIGGNLDRPMFNPSGQPGVRAQYVSPGVYRNPEANNATIDPMTAMYIGLPANTAADARSTGNLGRNTIRVAPINNFNVNLFKTFVILPENRLKAEFRTEFYNIWNHSQYGVASVSNFAPPVGALAVTVGSSLAGRFLQPQYMDGGARIIKYQLKLIF